LRLDRTAIDLGHDAVRAATGPAPRWLVTTTPKPIRLLRDLLALEGHGVVITRDSTLANAANLPPAFIEAVTKRYGGTRLGRQELNAELLEDTPGALWTRAMLEGAAFKEITPDMERIVVAVDPPGTSGADDGDSVGIVICGKGVDGLFYVIGDWSCKLSPAGWGRRAVAAIKFSKLVAGGRGTGIEPSPRTPSYRSV